MSSLTVRARSAHVIDALRGSLWPVPAALIGLGALAAMGSLALDRQHFVSESFGFSIFSAGPDGARATLSALATSLMTIAGISISLTMIVLQLASNQFSPRVVRSFLRDWLIQCVFGTYVGTFTFVLLILRSIRSANTDGVEFVAPFSVTLSLLSGTTCVVLLVVLVNHVARALRASAIIFRIAEETRHAIDEQYPERAAPSARADRADGPCKGEPTLLRAPTSGYLAYVDRDALARDTRRVEIDTRVGDFVCRGDVLGRAWPKDGRTARSLLRGVVLTTERTMQQDVRLGFVMLGDVALRALSPGINDPTTAIDCVNRIADLLCHLFTRPHPERADDHAAELRVIVASPSLEEIAGIALRPIVVFGRADARVFDGVLSALSALVARDAQAQARALVHELCDAIDAAAARAADWTSKERATTRARTLSIRTSA